MLPPQVVKQHVVCVIVGLVVGFGVGRLRSEAGTTRDESRERAMARGPAGGRRLAARWQMTAAGATAPVPTTEPLVEVTPAAHIAGASVIVRGQVRDARGPGIAGATITIGSSGTDADVAVKTAADGSFTARAIAGDLRVEAVATGFVTASVDAVASGSEPVVVDLLLVPAATVDGIAVRAGTSLGVAGATIDCNGASATSGTDGTFTLVGLPPGGCVLEATAAGLYGQAAGTVLAALGGTTHGIRIELYAAPTVRGIVMAASGGAPCAEGRVELEATGGRRFSSRTDDAGQVAIESVVPGLYHVTVECEGALALASYADVTVASADVSGLRWTVQAGARVTGHVRDVDGVPLAGAGVIVSSGEQRASATTGPDGAFTVEGVRPGVASVYASLDGYGSTDDDAQVVASRDEPATIELALAPAGRLTVAVVDADHQPVANVVVSIAGASTQEETTYRDGEATFHDLAPGSYAVRVGTQVAQAQVTRGSSQRIELVGEAAHGTLSVRVTDGSGAVVRDAFVDIAYEETGSSTSDRTPVLVDATGVAKFSKLVEGPYTVHAARPGGAEATTEHVATGTTAHLALESAGEIGGVVVDATGGAVDDAVIRIAGGGLPADRMEHVFRTGGRFAAKGLPAGAYTVSVEGYPRSAVPVTLHAGEQVGSVRIVAARGAVVRGRVVGRGGAGAEAAVVELEYVDQLGAVPGEATTSRMTAVLGVDGRFELRDVPAGPATLVGGPAGTEREDLATLTTVTVGASAVDVGTLTLPN